MSERIEFTDAAFVRSHGKAPRGVANGMGCWAFKRAAARTAFDHELEAGNPVFLYGTLTQAKAKLKAEHGGGLWAVLP